MKNHNMKKILITGGAGFVGTNLVFRLLDESSSGYHISILDNLSTDANYQYLKGIKNLTIHKMNLNEVNRLDNIIQGTDYLIHLAGHTYVRQSIKDPGYDFCENAINSFNLLNKSSKLGVKHFIFASTGAVVGNQDQPLKEDLFPQPISPYGASKLTAEMYCHVFSQISDMKCTALRFSNLFGPFSQHKTSVVSKFIQKILNKDEIEIYGDGSQTRDYLYTENLCDIFLKILDQDYKFNVFQVASGRETPLNELIDIIEEKMNKKAKRKYTDFIKGEVRYSAVNISKAKTILNYEPKISLEKGIEETIHWFLKET
jgi:UDP-glucose 4-epimerase